MSAEVVTLRPEGVPRRPAVRWLGSKWRMVPWILQHLPPHELYCEPYGGSASVLLRKPRSPIEVLGELDDELLTLYAVLRDPDMSARLRVACELTLFSDAEFRLAMRRLPLDADPVERARRMVVRHAMQVSPDVRAETAGTGFRRYTGPDRSVSAMDWSAYPDAIPEIHARLRGVVIERSPAVETIRRHDRVGALHYVDPPYVHATRQDGRKVYSHDMDDSGHRELLDCLLGLKGMAVVSGYASPLYDEALAGWRRGTREVTDHARQWRTEVLWISPMAAKAEATSLMMTGPRHPPRAGCHPGPDRFCALSDLGADRQGRLEPDGIKSGEKAGNAPAREILPRVSDRTFGDLTPWRTLPV